eukprot:scaffold16810_cov21-Tisochrysis_lutea.AAC.1
MCASGCSIVRGVQNGAAEEHVATPPVAEKCYPAPHPTAGSGSLQFCPLGLKSNSYMHLNFLGSTYKLCAPELLFSQKQRFYLCAQQLQLQADYCSKTAPWSPVKRIQASNLRSQPHSGLLDAL